MIRTLAQAGFLGCLLLSAPGCSRSTEPRPLSVADYHYELLGGKRYFEVRLVTDSAVVDTVLDSLWRVFTDTEGIRWAQSALRTPKPSVYGRSWQAIDAASSIRHVGLRSDTIFFDLNLQDRLLVGPLEPGRRWFVRSDSTIGALLVGEVDLVLGLGTVRCWHVNMGAVADEWWALGLGRVQYEEFNPAGERVRGRLIAVGAL